MQPAAGKTLHKLIVCQITSIAIGTGVPALHRNCDFDVLARHTELNVHEAEPSHEVTREIVYRTDHDSVGAHQQVRMTVNQRKRWLIRWFPQC